MEFVACDTLPQQTRLCIQATKRGFGASPVRKDGDFLTVDLYEFDNQRALGTFTGTFSQLVRILKRLERSRGSDPFQPYPMLLEE